MRVVAPSLPSAGDRPRRRLRRAGATVLSAAMLAAGAGLVLPGRSASADATFDSDLMALVNQDRSDNGLAPVQWENTLGSIAESGGYDGCGFHINGRATDMVQRNYFAHVIPNCGGQNVFNIMQADGVPFRSAGENIGWLSGESDPAKAAARLNDMFMNSPEHRANILNPNYTHAAIGSASAASWSGGGSQVSNVIVTAEEFAQLPPGAGSSGPSARLSSPPTAGYWLAGRDGGVFAFGNAPFLGSAGNIRLAAPVVGISRTGDGGGYWLVASDGGVFTYGNSSFHGSTGATHLNAPIVGIAATPDGGGYWLVAADGGVFAFGNAGFHGSTGGLRLNRPIIGIAATPDGGGYWLVAADGGVFTFGNAAFHGSTGGLRLNSAIVDVAATADGGGYWLVAGDGGVFGFGDAPFLGSTGGMRLNQPITRVARNVDGRGYWLIASDGGTFSFGDAPFEGSTGGLRLNAPIIAASGH
jgi:uncharacterized protein YkwD